MRLLVGRKGVLEDRLERNERHQCLRHGAWYGHSVLCLTVSRQLSPRQAVSPTHAMFRMASLLGLRTATAHICRSMGVFAQADEYVLRNIFGGMGEKPHIDLTVSRKPPFCETRGTRLNDHDPRVQFIHDLRQAGSPEEMEKFSALVCDLKNRIYMRSYYIQPMFSKV